MSRGAKLRKHGTVVRISQQYNQPWRGFTLQKGHLYGEDDKGYFVSAAKPAGIVDMIEVYRCDTRTGDYVWTKTAESKNTDTVQKILHAVSLTGHKITYEPEIRQVRTFYSRLPASSPKPQPVRARSYMADTHTVEEYHAITVSSYTNDLWSDAAKAQKAAHKERWIREFMQKDYAAAERIYDLLYGEA